VKFAFIEAERACFPIAFMCRHLGVSTSGFYASQKRPESTHAARKTGNSVLAREAHLKGRRAYGSPRVHRELRTAGRRVGRKRVARVMREANIAAKHKRRFVRTTDSNHVNPIAPNVLQREFTTDAPNKVWVTDITYIPTRQGWLYLAVIVDLFSRRVVGWAMEATMETDLVLSALRMALAQRRWPRALRHHSDRGSQYASGEYRRVLELHGITASMSRKGNCWDNAVAESFFGSLKKEYVHDVTFRTREEARSGIFEWIEVFYNRQRLHSTLDYMTPDQFEREQRAGQKAA